MDTPMLRQKKLGKEITRDLTYISVTILDSYFTFLPRDALHPRY